MLKILFEAGSYFKQRRITTFLTKNARRYDFFRYCLLVLQEIFVMIEILAPQHCCPDRIVFGRISFKLQCKIDD